MQFVTIRSATYLSALSVFTHSLPECGANRTIMVIPSKARNLVVSVFPFAVIPDLIGDPALYLSFRGSSAFPFPSFLRRGEGSLGLPRT